eukprot:7740577-Pyramimonas_sp.AAC.1
MRWSKLGAASTAGRVGLRCSEPHWVQKRYVTIGRARASLNHTLDQVGVDRIIQIQRAWQPDSVALAFAGGMGESATEARYIDENAECHFIGDRVKDAMGFTAAELKKRRRVFRPRRWQ